MEDHNGFDFLPYLYGELISQLAESCDIVSRKLRKIHGEINKIMSKLASHSFSQQMDIANQTFYDIRITLDLLKHCFVHLFLEVGALLKGPSRPEMACKLDVLTSDHVPTDFYSIYIKSLGIYHTAHSGLLIFPNIHSLLLHPFLSAWRAYHVHFPRCLILWHYFRLKHNPYSVAWSLLP